MDKLILFQVNAHMSNALGTWGREKHQITFAQIILTDYHTILIENGGSIALQLNAIDFQIDLKYHARTINAGTRVSSINIRRTQPSLYFLVKVLIVAAINFEAENLLIIAGILAVIVVFIILNYWFMRMA